MSSSHTQWYYANRPGQKIGPISSSRLRQLAAAGAIEPTATIWKEGVAKGIPATSVKGLFDAKRTTPTVGQANKQTVECGITSARVPTPGANNSSMNFPRLPSPECGDQCVVQPSRPNKNRLLIWVSVAACICFVVILCLAVLGVGTYLTLQSRSVANIERVLKEDSTTTAGAKSASEVVSRMRAISHDGCPQDFKLAYLDHIRAWESMVAVEREALALDANFNGGGAMVEAFMRGMVFDFGMLPELRAAQDRLRTNYERASTEIRNTFHRVQENAIRHGASLPKPRPSGPQQKG
jgi:hypothetical protein